MNKREKLANTCQGNSQGETQNYPIIIKRCSFLQRIGKMQIKTMRYISCKIQSKFEHKDSTPSEFIFRVTTAYMQWEMCEGLWQHYS